MLTIRPMRKSDNSALLAVIQQCVLEYGYTHSPYVTHAHEEGDIFEGFSAANSCMYVIVDDTDTVIGGGGFAPVQGMENLCEIKKVYFAPRARGVGMGRKLVERLMAEAAPLGFSHYYIETVPEMETAVALYEKLGFTPTTRQSAAGHDCCSMFMHKAITSAQKQKEETA